MNATSAQELAVAAIREALSGGAAYDAVGRVVPDFPGLGRAQLIDAVDELLRTGQITVTAARVEPALTDLTVYRAQRGTDDDPHPTPVGTWLRLADAQAAADDAYRAHFDPHDLDTVEWRPVGDERIWLHSSRGGEPWVRTEWHVQPCMVQGGYDPDAEG